MLGRLLKDTHGAAAAEMALIAPLLIVLMFGAMELGYYFYSEHVVIKAVRDGARFASRESFDDFTCPAGTIDATVENDTQKITRTNTVDGTGIPRLPNWTSDASVTVTVDCIDNSSGTYSAIYEDLTSVPVVKVSAAVPYTSLFGLLGFRTTNLQLKATSEATVMGV
jgi:Flp pilus assembly protein TadG